MLKTNTLIGVFLTALLTLILFHPLPASASPTCDMRRINNCSADTPGGGGGGSDGGGSGDGGSGGRGSEGGGSGGGNGGNNGGGSGGGGGGGGGLPDCPTEDVGHLCVSEPGPGGGGGGGGGAPARPDPPTRIPESQFQNFDIPAPTIYAWPKDWAVVGKPDRKSTRLNSSHPK